MSGLISTVFNTVRNGLSAAWNFIASPFTAPASPPAAPVIIVAATEVPRGDPQYYWLAPIRWRTKSDDEHEQYEHPNMFFDSRNLPDQGVPALTDGRNVLCAGPVMATGPDVMPIGEIGHTLTPGVRATLSRVVGEPLPAITVEQMVERLAVNLTDPTGQARCKPVLVGRGMRLRFKIGNVIVNRLMQPTDSEWQSTLAVERLNYAVWAKEARASAQALRDAGRTWESVVGHFRDKTHDARDLSLLRMGAPHQHLKNLDYLRVKYGRDYHDFLGAEPDEGLRLRDTTVIETWACPDSDSLNCDQLHTETVSDTDIVGGDAENTLTVGNRARMEADVSSVDHYVESSMQITVTSVRDVFVCARYAAAAETLMRGGHRNNATDTYRIDKVVTGTSTNLVLASATAPGSGKLLSRLTCDGSNHDFTSAGVSRVAVVDSSITTGTRAGINGLANGANRAQWAGLEITDLAVAQAVGGLVQRQIEALLL